MTLDSGTGRITTILVCAVLTGSCVSRNESPVDWPGIADEIEVTHTHLPTKCRHLYDVGRSVEWQICMGVGPK